jgi:hypothetical protein
MNQQFQKRKCEPIESMSLNLTDQLDAASRGRADLALLHAKVAYPPTPL